MNRLDDLKVKIVEYKGEVIIETLKPEKDEYFHPVTEPGKVGAVLINTGKFLGVSEQAWKIIKKFKRSGDAIGDVMAWKSDKGDCFGWLGPLGRRVGPDAEVDRDGIKDIEFVKIQNVLNPKIKEIIDRIDQGNETN